MAREFGTFPVAANYEPQVGAPFDARSLVKTKAALMDGATWLQADGGMYIYSGMLVAVWNDIPENNGLYILKDRKNYSLEASWIKLADISQISALEEKINNLSTLDTIQIIYGGDSNVTTDI